ncbi:hypothetical protein [Sphingobium sp. B2]|uniref:hypothetical protein n=1 Tax=Sphingobium sp. B2 TaxID=2583228 RepID=UPI0011A3039F|nr:hypothetical protein [Sphingobium sp. B2]
MKMLARATAGLWLWAFTLSLLYALHGIGCARGWDGLSLFGGTMFRWAVVVTWLCFALGGVAVILSAKRAPKGFERHLSITSSIVGLVSTLVVGLPTVMTSACL